MATAGEDPTPLFNFWERLQKNPSFRSVKQLWGFLNHQGIPLTPDGCFLAYKSVREDYKDVHSGKFDNRPGAINEMPRNQISDDPNHACHEGFHVGALGYAQSFGGSRIVVCKVDPEHVVCVPYDASQQKMRVCRYEVIGNHGSELPSTTVTHEDIPPPREEKHLIDEDEPSDRGCGDDEDDLEDEGIDEEGEPEPHEGEEFGGEAESEPAKDQRSIAEVSDKPSEVGGVQVPAEYAHYINKGTDELLEHSIDELRKYATYGLKIVGASKIPGGKVALVAAIMKTRSGQK